MTDPRSLWDLDPDVAYLNHGSFGACPRPVLERQTEWQRTMERQPVDFLVRKLEPLLDEARRRLAGFVAADPAGIAFVPNATHGVAAVIGSTRLSPGDEILVTSHGYNAVANIAAAATAGTGATVRVADIPFAGVIGDSVLAAITGAVGERTRLVVVDHVTSPTALVLPVAEIVAALEPEVPVLIDGAHGPGMVPVDLAAIGASYYAGNCHKWLGAPKGSGFLYAAEPVRPDLVPPVVSHGWNTTRSDRSRFHQMFDWTGTFDPSPYLAVPRAIDVLGGLFPGGWEELRRRNRALALLGRDIVAAALPPTDPLPPAEMIGSMASLPLPPGPLLEPPDPAALSTILATEHRVEVPVFPWPGPPHRMLRISAQAYNTVEDYEGLAGALRTMLG